MPEEWLIDGYNLLYDLKKSRTSPAVSREQLFGLLASFASMGERRVLMVLDGVGNDAEFESCRTAAFQIIYSQSVSADSYIEKYLYDKKGKVRFVVVTRDRAIANIASGTGARVMDPRVFMETMAEGQKDGADILFQHKVKAHGFNRPFDGKL